MRLLQCIDGKFKFTRDLVRDIPRYAILSHTWCADTEEVTFRDVVDGTGEDKMGYDKIRFCAAQAKRDCLRYFWVDTCCIDKSNNNELSTAVNSMFRWYQNAARCYVYLSDVSISDNEEDGQQSEIAWESAFRASKWFTRGWTLQELLAPPSVEFFTAEGRRLGDKRSLEDRIHEITGIPIPALRGSTLAEFDIEERFKWAEARQTTHEEDWAYSLLGIFSVFIPLIYGEGKANAVRRLRKEIVEAMDKNHTLDHQRAQSRIPVYTEPISVRGFTTCKGIAESRISWLARLEHQGHHDELKFDKYESRDGVIGVFFSSDLDTVMDTVKEECHLGRVRNILDFINLASDLKRLHTMDGHIECHIKRKPRYFSVSEISPGALSVEAFRTSEETGEYHIWIKTRANFTPTWDLQQTEEQEKATMATRRREFGSEHPDTRTRMLNLASTYRSQGKWKEAKELLTESMETSKRVLGPEHPDTLNSMSNLASAYRSLGQLKEAEDLFIQAAEISSKTLGPEHSGILYVMDNLASIRKARGMDCSPEIPVS